MRAVLRIDERIRLSRNACLISLAVRPVRMLVADLITLAAAFAQYDALHSVAIRDGAPLVWNDGFSVACEAGAVQLRWLELSEPS